MKCHKCKKEFELNELTTARNAKGERPKSKTAKLYCKFCEQEQYNNAILIEYLHQWFLYKGYYDNSHATKESRKRYMALINTQISNLLKNGYSSQQIKLILEYMIQKEGIEFSDTILGLVPYYYSKTSKYYTELFNIGQSKKYGYIKPTRVDESKRMKYKPNRESLRMTNIETL